MWVPSFGALLPPGCLDQSTSAFSLLSARSLLKLLSPSEHHKLQRLSSTYASIRNCSQGLMSRVSSHESTTSIASCRLGSTKRGDCINLPQLRVKPSPNLPMSLSGNQVTLSVAGSGRTQTQLVNFVQPKEGPFLGQGHR